MSAAAASIFLRSIRQTTCRLSTRSFLRTAAGIREPQIGVSSQLRFHREFSAEPAAPAEEKPIIPGIGKGKTSTGIVGLAVEPDWYNVLLKKFQLLLDTLEASDMPETAQYRIDVTKWANFVIATVKANPDDPETVEDEVRMGQVEELIEMADDEMIAMNVYLKSRMWEHLDPEGPEVDFSPDPMKDEMAEGEDPRTQRKIQEDLDKMMDFGIDDDDDEEDLEPDLAEFRD